MMGIFATTIGAHALLWVAEAFLCYSNWSTKGPRSKTTVTVFALYATFAK
jgi:hypothetical protein